MNLKFLFENENANSGVIFGNGSQNLNNCIQALYIDERDTLSVPVCCPLFLFSYRNLQAGNDSDVIVNFKRQRRYTST